MITIVNSLLEQSTFSMPSSIPAYESDPDVDECIDFFNKNLGFEGTRYVPRRNDLKAFAHFLTTHDRVVPFHMLLTIPADEYYQEVRGKY